MIFFKEFKKIFTSLSFHFTLSFLMSFKMSSQSIHPIHPEALRHVLSFLPMTHLSISKLRQVSKHWNRSLSDESIEIDSGLSTFNIDSFHIGKFPHLGFREDLMVKHFRKFFGERCTSITWTNDSYSNPFFTDFIQLCPNLVSLDISWASRLTYYPFVSMIAKCPKLKKLILSGCRRLGDYVVKSIALKCRDLEFLDLSGGISFSDEALIEIARNCKKLISIDITGAGQYVTVMSISELIDCCPDLKSIVAVGCDGLTALQETCLNVRELNSGPPELRVPFHPKIEKYKDVLVWKFHRKNGKMVKWGNV